MAALFAVMAGAGCGDGPAGPTGSAPGLGYIVFANRVGFTTAFGWTYEDNEFWTVREDGANLRLLVPGNGRFKDWPVISPDGDLLAWSAFTDPGCVEAFVSRLDGSSVRKVSGDDCASGFAIAPFWSPDGSRLLYSGSVDRYSPQYPYIVNADGSGRRLIPALTCDAERSNAPCFGHLQSELLFMPDGNEVVMVLSEVVSASPTVTRSVVVKWNLETDRYVRVWHDVGGLVPRLSHVHPGGEWAVGVGLHDEQVILISLTGSGVHKVFARPFERASWPYFCGDGTWICYVPDMMTRSIRRMDMNGQNDQEVFRLAGSLDSGIRRIGTMRPHPLY